MSAWRNLRGNANGRTKRGALHVAHSNAAPGLRNGQVKIKSGRMMSLTQAAFRESTKSSKNPAQFFLETYGDRGALN